MSNFSTKVEGPLVTIKRNKIRVGPSGTSNY
jgi:hypothetical protein